MLVRFVVNSVGFVSVICNEICCDLCLCCGVFLVDLFDLLLDSWCLCLLVIVWFVDLCWCFIMLCSSIVGFELFVLCVGLLICLFLGVVLVVLCLLWLVALWLVLLLL